MLYVFNFVKLQAHKLFSLGFGYVDRFDELMEKSDDLPGGPNFRHTRNE